MSAAKRRKLVTMRVTVSVPRSMNARDARREARFLINTGAGWATFAGEALKVKRVAPDGAR